MNQAAIPRLEGTRVDGRYDVHELIDHGAAGAVFRATAHDGRPAAIKVMLTTVQRGSALAERFLREARITMALHHPNVVELWDAGILPDGNPYLAMEGLRGETLRHRLERQPAPPLADVLRWTDGVLCALEAAHGAGVTHRDIKPENVFLQRLQSAERAKLLDFGAAKMADAPDMIRLTARGELVGTPHYMAPEQMSGMLVDGRTDIWAVGVLMYEMLAGRRPFDAPTLIGIAGQVAAVEPTPVHLLRPGLSPLFSELVSAALRKQLDERFPSARAMREQLRAVLAKLAK